jgi:hypothetical protein
VEVRGERKGTPRKRAHSFGLCDMKTKANIIKVLIGSIKGEVISS